MDGKYEQTLSIFFDGEHVDADLLADSLAQPGAGEVLAGFAAMRAKLAQDTSQPSPEFVERMRRTLRRADRVRSWRRGLPKAALAASLLVVAALGGFELGSFVSGSRSSGGPSVAAPASPSTAASLPIARPGSASSAPVPSASGSAPAGRGATESHPVSPPVSATAAAQTHHPSIAPRPDEPPPTSLRLRWAGNWQTVAADPAAPEGARH